MIVPDILPINKLYIKFEFVFFPIPLGMDEFVQSHVSGAVAEFISVNNAKIIKHSEYMIKVNKCQ